MSNPTNEAPDTRLDRPHFGRLLLHLALISCLSMGLLVQPAQAGDKQEGKVRNSRWVYEEVLQSPARRLPGADARGDKMRRHLPRPSRRLPSLSADATVRE